MLGESPDTHGEAAALVGAREEARGVRVHLLVLEAGRGAVRGFATQGCPEIVWKTERETDASPVHGTTPGLWFGQDLKHSSGSESPGGLQTYMRVLLNNENSPRSPSAHVHILFRETEYSLNNC